MLPGDMTNVLHNGTSITKLNKQTLSNSAQQMPCDGRTHQSISKDMESAHPVSPLCMEVAGRTSPRSCCLNAKKKMLAKIQNLKCPGQRHAQSTEGLFAQKGTLLAVLSQKDEKSDLQEILTAGSSETRASKATPHLFRRDS